MAITNKKIPYRSLISRATLSIALVIIIFGFLAALSVFWLAENSFYDENKNILSATLQSSSHQVEQLFDDSIAAADYLSKSTAIINVLSSEQPAIQDPAVVERLNDANIGGEYSIIYLLDKNGVAIVSTDPSLLGNDYRFRNYFHNAIDGQAKMVANFGVTTHELGFYYAVPVKDNQGQILGAVVIKINSDAVVNDLNWFNFDASYKLMIVDDNGVIIASSVQDRKLKSLGVLSAEQQKNISDCLCYQDQAIKPLFYDFLQSDIAGITGYKLFDFNDRQEGRRELLGVIKVGKFDFYMIFEADASRYIRPALNISLLLVLFVVLAAGSAIFISVLFIRNLLRPIKKLNEAALKISRGDWGAYLQPLKHYDELQTMTEAFNQMLSAVNNSKQETEKKVKQQTKEISRRAEVMAKQQKAILNILEDVEEEKNRAEDLAAIVRGAEQPIIGKTLAGTITSWNKGAENLYGYTAKEAIGKNIRITAPPDRYQEIDDFLKKISEGKEIEHFQTVRKRKDGSLVDISLSVSPVKDSQGRIIGASAVQIDITKEKQIDQAKTEFVSLASHQLRTPLAAVNWYTEILLKGAAGKLNKDQKSYLTEVRNSNKRMVALVNAFLNVSRIDLGTFAIEPKLIDFKKISRSIIGELKPQIVKKKIKLAEHYSKDLPLVKADPNLVRILIQNLLTNAIKYTPAKGKVSVILSKQGENILISIADNGYGIPENAKVKIFTKLFRADNVRNKETDGTGLGLYMVKSIVEKAGGKVWFTSKENKGSTFYISLPLKGMKKKVGTKELSPA